MTMPELKNEVNLVDELAEEFACRWRAGERPSVEEYAERYPEQADEIRAVLPAVVMMEQLKPRREEETPASTPASYPDTPPERIGEYRVIREIGRGGMGVVYEAEQEPLGRRVAIKVLPVHLLANETLRARFRRESQAAARLHHTNIVPVYGVGEHDGQCFYVMQLIDGRGLDHVIRTAVQRTSPTDDSTPIADVSDITWPNGMPGKDHATHADGEEQSPREFCETVARIGVQVADALAHAHSQGILHRDVKPSNLLLDSRGSVWMTDFGVAKLVEEANLTLSGDIVGTLKYMPPERFSGQSDARGDVYSLGVTLYELLTLRPAFPDTTPQHLIKLITHEAPIPPRKLNPNVPKDLETIVLKATARDPAQRYQTPDELEEDLRRFLDDRPILARRARLTESLWRWCRRNRMVAALTVVVFSLLALTAVVSVAAWYNTASAKDRMETALEKEQQQREHAEKTTISALEAMNRIYDRFAPSRIVVTPGLPADSSDEAGINLPPQPVLSPEAVPLLQDLLGFYEQLAREVGDYSRLRPQAAEANQRIGDIRQRLGQLDAAITAYRKAAELYGRLLADRPDEAMRIKLARTHNELGRVLRSLHQAEAANKAHGDALITLAAAPRESTSKPEFRYELARSYYFQSLPEGMARPRGPEGLGPPRDPGGPREFGDGPPRGPGGFGRPPGPRPGGPRGPGPGGRGPGGPGPGGPGPGGPESGGQEPGGPGPGRGEPPPPPSPERIRYSQLAIELLEGLVKEHSAVPEYYHLLACCYRDAPPDRLRGGPQGEAANTQQAINILRQLVQKFPKIPDYRYDLCETLGRVAFVGRPLAGDSAEAARLLLKEAVDLSTALTADYPNVPQYTASQAVAQEKYGLVLQQFRQLDEAEKRLKTAVALQTKVAKQHPEVVAYGFSLSLMETSLARLLGEREKWKDARPLLESSTKRLEGLLAKDQRLSFARMHLGHGYGDLSVVLARLGEAGLAEEAQRKAESFAPDRGPERSGPRDRRRER
jgi:serine/threonine protein kinase